MTTRVLPRTSRLGRFSTIYFLAGLLLGPLVSTAGAANPVDFQREIRPLLSNACFRCHGPDDQARKGKLRLDSREHAVKGGRSGDPAFVPGKANEGEAIRRMLSTDPKKMMPPPNAAKKLTPWKSSWSSAGSRPGRTISNTGPSCRRAARGAEGQGCRLGAQSD